MCTLAEFPNLPIYHTVIYLKSLIVRVLRVSYHKLVLQTPFNRTDII